MSRNSSQFSKHGELVRSLRRQLEATEQALADQKWVFQQFLESPSWRLTYPIRWLAQKLRALWTGIKGGSTVAAVYDGRSVGAHRPPPQPETEEPEEFIPSEFKEFLTSLYRVALQSFLSSGIPLQLPHSERPEISIILVLFNRAELTLACLRSITESHGLPREIIIVDNASSDETPLMLDLVRSASVIRNKENLNFVLAVNRAAAEARGEYLLILNNDTQLMPGTLLSALRTIRSAPDIGAVGGRLILLDGTLQEAGSIIWRDGSCYGYGRGDNPFAPMYMFRRDVDYCSAAFLLTPRAVWEQSGGFDEIFKPAYYEETDYCMRLWEQGLRVVYEPNAVLLHYEFASSASVKKAIDLQREHRLIFAARHEASLSNHQAPDLTAVLTARLKGDKKRVLFIEDKVPHIWLGSGFPRSRTILLGLLRQGFFVTFYPLDLVDEDWASVYSDMPAEVEFMTGYGPLLLEAFLRNRRGYYDTIFVSRPHNMNLVRSILEAHPEWFEQTNIIYDAEALFALREITMRQLIGTPFSPEETEDIIKAEVTLAGAADCVISVSESEGRTFEKHGIDRAQILGHAIPVSPTPRPFQQRKGFLFVGPIYKDATPNGDSLIWFLEEIFPKIQERLGSEATFILAGVNKSERVSQLAGQSVHITGHLPDLSDLYDSARVFVAPTRYAAGLPHKVHEAVARGVPAVVTPLLASQLGWQDSSPLLVGGDADEFTEKCIQLYTTEALWTRLREAGLERIRTDCSIERFESQLKAIMKVERARFTDVGMDR